ncbi:MAG TPA: hypothetical protein VHT04_15580 [Stellaceae bacterium]|jgi:hypothetical protein|nr:hypothetical protein [Stellaceae bacterium]
MPEFFESRKLRYEIHSRCEKRWQIAEIVGDGREELSGRFGRTNFEEIERAVLSKANALLAGGEVEAVRVTRDRVRDDGFTTTSEIFFKEASGGKSEPPLTVGRHDGAMPLCAEPADLYARPACKVIGTVLRSFLDRQFITALDLLHFHPYIRKLNENFSLFQGAIHQVSTAQVKESGEDLKSRGQKLYGLTEAVETRARDAMAEKDLPAIEGDDFAGFADRMAARYQGEQCRYFTMVGVARHFQGAASFLARLDFVLAHLPVARSADMRDLLDSFAADCLESSQLVVDLLGYQPNLAAALGALSDLACGDGEGGAADSSLAKLRSLIGAGGLPLTAATLWDRILRELNRGRPLSRTDQKQEWNLLMKLSDRLLVGCPPERKGAVEGAIKDRMRRLRDAAG